MGVFFLSHLMPQRKFVLNNNNNKHHFNRMNGKIF